tara:strand:- start:617 stop:1060 length:444 start_codon:yes stop_codon:yes gene_type:complete
MGLLDNLFIYTLAKVNNGLTKYSINSSCTESSIKELVSVINKETYKKVVLVCRSENEPHAEQFPKKEYIEYIKQNSNKEVKIFYQDPFPSVVPNFSNEYMVIRFGFDSGCEFDKSVSEVYKTDLNDGVNTILYNKNKYINLNRKSIL